MKISFAFRTRLITFPRNNTFLFAMQLLIFVIFPSQKSRGCQNDALTSNSLDIIPFQKYKVKRFFKIFLIFLKFFLLFYFLQKKKGPPLLLQTLAHILYIRRAREEKRLPVAPSTPRLPTPAAGFTIPRALLRRLSRRGIHLTRVIPLRFSPTFRANDLIRIYLHELLKLFSASRTFIL